jgi:chemotaxis protein CheD
MTVASPTRAEARPYLHPGELLAAPEPCTVTTILGSCVAACLYDAEAGIGGLTHSVLPHAPAGAVHPGRFGDRAVVELVRRLLAAGARAHALRAKLFGGACVLDAFAAGRNHLGAQNVASARDALHALAIPVVAEDVGGRRGRRLLFQTGDGTALVRTL